MIKENQKNLLIDISMLFYPPEFHKYLKKKNHNFDKK